MSKNVPNLGPQQDTEAMKLARLVQRILERAKDGMGMNLSPDELHLLGAGFMTEAGTKDPTAKWLVEQCGKLAKSLEEERETTRTQASKLKRLERVEMAFEEAVEKRTKKLSSEVAKLHAALSGLDGERLEP